jgi:FkbM family methyltransferase
MKVKSLLRRIFIPFFKRVNAGDIKIKHHYTGESFFLHSFKHKSYWYHGKNREVKSMQLFERLIDTDNIVLEIGGHIGYLTTFFASCVGHKGEVFVFEPGINNYPYLEKNVSNFKNINLYQKAVSDIDGELSFYLEDFSGQNNSILPDYKGIKMNQKNANVSVVQKEVKVQSVTVDSFLDTIDKKPNFIKIDVEGAEKMVLIGMKNTLSYMKPLLMVEITHDKAEVMTMLHEYGYTLFNENMDEIKHSENIDANTFCFHSEVHQNLILDLSNSRQ